ncbi:MAG: exodeoxyribonuclease III [Planctomycetota bacterium]|nr:MAG: exodeoxyribonuclease III [Planctomycetota bacterium]
MKIISWNVNGVRAIQKKGFLDFLTKENPDILCLQETKAQEDQLDENLISPKKYQTIWASAEKKGYSGVAIFTKKEPNKIIKGLGVKKLDSEGRTIIAEYDDFVLFNIYFPNGQKDEIRLQYKMDFYAAFLKVSEKYRKAGKHVITCGDYNTAHKEIDLTHPKPNEKYSGFLPMEREWMDKYISKGYLDTFREKNTEPKQYTWWTYRGGARAKNVGWRIDYFFINEEMKKNLKDAFILQEVMGSDHCPLGIKIKF